MKKNIIKKKQKIVIKLLNFGKIILNLKEDFRVLKVNYCFLKVN